MNFNEAVQVILNMEGGLVDHPRDPGGLTNFGISKRAYPNVNIISLTRDQAKEIYKKDYWEKCKIELLPEALRLIVFDCAVNQGQGTAIKLLQQSVGVPDDGILGAASLEKIESMPVELVIKAYAKRRLARYFDTKNFEVMGEGWITRLLDIVILSSIFRA